MSLELLILLYTIGRPWPVQEGFLVELCNGRCALTWETQFPAHVLSMMLTRLRPAPQQVEGVPALRAGVNPATWMLEVSTLNKEHELGVDFAQIYRTSALFR